MVIQPIIGAISGNAQADAANQAAQRQTEAANSANYVSQQQFAQTQANIQPFVNAGQGALPNLNALLGIGGDPTSAMNALNNMPGYQFTLGQGLKATQNVMAARGLGQSGAALKGAANYATGLANNNYQGYATNLQNLVNSGANAAGGLGTLGANAAANQGNNLIGAGNAQASAANAQALPITNAMNGISNSVGNAQQLYLLNGLLQSQGQNGLFGSNKDNISGNG